MALTIDNHHSSPEAHTSTGPLDVTFTATVERSASTGGWTYVIWPDSTTFFGTRARVKIAGTVDGMPIRTSFMPLGDGRHKLPVTREVLTTIGKTEGDTVTVYLTDRLACPQAHPAVNTANRPDASTVRAGTP